jgi:hypothetical protein
MRILPVEFSARAVEVTFPEGAIHVRLEDGREITVPLAYFATLANATPEQLQHFEILPGGDGIHWPQLDEDLSVAGFLRTR